MRSASITIIPSLILAIGLGGALPSAAFAEGGNTALPRPPLVVADPAYDWSGAYVGLGLSMHSGDVNFGGPFVQPLEDATAATIFAGYAFQSGNLVYGAELAYSSYDQLYDDAIPFDDGLNNMFDASLRLGYAFDNILLYALAGYSQATAFNFGPGGPREADATGWHHGIGVAYGVNDRFEVSLQYIWRDLTFSSDPGNPEGNAGHETLSLRAAFRF